MGRFQDIISQWFGRSGRVRLKSRQLAGMQHDEVFSTIYKHNAWKGSQSVSGTGSDAQQTAKLAAELPRVLRDLEVNSLLDVPCGDFFWMRDVDLEGIQYVGGDIVHDLVAGNQQYASDSRLFVQCDLLQDELPSVDAIFCRDCLVHFRTDHVWQALRNIANSAARFLITTTFVDRSNDRQIETGQWRPLNLQSQPFDLPAPIEYINEECTQDDGAYPDKMMGVWAIDSIREALLSHGQQAA